MQIADLAITVASLMPLATAALATSRTQLCNPAKRLAHETRIAATHADIASPNYLADAKKLARSSEHFRSDVETQTVSDAKVNAQFRRVARDYQRFKEEVRHANTRQAFTDLNAVTTPYQEVERELGISAEAVPPPPGD
jgi:hypothetical protein